MYDHFSGGGMCAHMRLFSIFINGPSSKNNNETCTYQVGRELSVIVRISDISGVCSNTLESAA